MKYLMYVAGMIASLLFTSCDSGKFKESEDGYSYKIVRDEDGPMPQDGSFIQYNFEYKDENDSMIIDSKEYSSPVIIQCQTATWENSGPLYKALNLIGEGDSAIFRIPTKALFEESFRNQVPPGVNPDGTITVYIGVENIMMQEEFEQMLTDRAAGQLEKDVAEIEAYLDKNNIEAQSTETGLRYTILEEGSGKQPQPGDMVKVHYRGTLLDGTEFDSSYGRNEPFSFNVGQGNVIKGWDEGVPLLKEGGKAVFYIPSTLAYGERGAGGIIEPNTVLRFEVELLEVE